jgi:hypothetical protein
MFENDRFGHDVDYAITYRHLGGSALSDTAFRRAVGQLFNHFLAAYDDAACADTFPTIAEAVAELLEQRLVRMGSSTSRSGRRPECTRV